MGVIRGGLLVVASVLFFILVLIGGTLWIISSSLEYEVIKPELSSIVVKAVNDNYNLSEMIEEKMPMMEMYCKDNTDFVFSQSDYTINVSCRSVENGTDAIIEEGIGEIVEDTYYKDYDCDFASCFKENPDKPFFLVSKMAMDFWRSQFYFVLIFSFIVLVIMFFLVEKKSNFPIIAGSLLIISSLLFLKLDVISSFSQESVIAQFITVFFTQSYSVFLRFFILGILVILSGIFLKIFGTGFRISGIIEKFQKKEVKDVDDKKSVKREKIR